jgi:spore germination protein YaaH
MLRRGMRQSVKKLSVIVLFATTSVVLFAATSALARTKTLFYMADHPDSVRDFMGHQTKIDIIVPTWYNIDANGLVYDEADPVVMRVVKQRRISLFPIVAIFDRTGVHTLLTSDKAQIGMIGSLISECKRNGYDGFQLDFENIAWTDRDDLSATVERIAHAMHQERLQLQIAVVPNAPGIPATQHSASGSFWTGAGSSISTRSVTPSI